MAAIVINNLRCISIDSPFTAPLEFQVEFECVRPLDDAFQWTITYISNPADSTQDQILDAFDINAPQTGSMAFSIQTNGPDPSSIPDPACLLNVAALTISCSYRQQEFFICGYYCENYVVEQCKGLYYGPDGLLSPNVQLDVGHVRKRLAVDKPRITRKDIDWSERVAMLEIEGVPLDQVLVNNLHNNHFQDQPINNQNFGTFMNSNNFGTMPNSMDNIFQG